MSEKYLRSIPCSSSTAIVCVHRPVITMAIAVLVAAIWEEVIDYVPTWPQEISSNSSCLRPSEDTSLSVDGVYHTAHECAYTLQLGAHGCGTTFMYHEVNGSCICCESHDYGGESEEPGWAMMVTAAHHHATLHKLSNAALVWFAMTLLRMSITNLKAKALKTILTACSGMLCAWMWKATVAGVKTDLEKLVSGEGHEDDAFMGVRLSCTALSLGLAVVVTLFAIFTGLLPNPPAPKEGCSLAGLAHHGVALFVGAMPLPVAYTWNVVKGDVIRLPMPQEPETSLDPGSEYLILVGFLLLVAAALALLLGASKVCLVPRFERATERASKDSSKALDQYRTPLK